MPERRRRGVRRFAVWALVALLTVVALLAGSWLLLPQWLPLLADELARQKGMQIRLDGLQRPSPRDWRIASITVDWRDGTRLRVDDVQMGWVCCDPWRHPLVLAAARVQIDPAVVAFETARRIDPAAVSPEIPQRPDSDHPAAPVGSGPSIKTRLEGWHGQLPSLQVTIDTLHFNHPTVPVLARRLNAVRDPAGFALTGESGWRDLAFTLAMQWSSGNRLQANLQSGTDHLRLEGVWQDSDVTDGQWVVQLSQEVDLARVLRELDLQSLLDPLRVPPVSLRVQGESHIILPDRFGGSDWQAHLAPHLTFTAEAPGLTLVMTPEILLQGRWQPQTLTLQPLRASLHAEAWPTPLSGFLPPDLTLDLLTPLTCTRDDTGVDCSRQVSLLAAMDADASPGYDGPVRTGRVAAAVEMQAEDRTAALELDLQLTLADVALPEQVSLATAFTLDWRRGLALTALRNTRVEWKGLPLRFARAVSFHGAPSPSTPSRSTPSRSTLSQSAPSHSTPSRADPLYGTAQAGSAARNSAKADGEVDLGGLRLTLADWGAPQPWMAQATLDGRVSLRSPDLHTDLDLHAEVRASDRTLGLSRGRVSALGLDLPFVLDATSDLGAGTLSYRLKGRLSDSALLTRWLPDGVEGVRLLPGDIDAEGRVDWGAKVQSHPQPPAGGAPKAFVATAKGTLQDWSVGNESLMVNRLHTDFDILVDPDTLHLQTPLRLEAADVVAPVRLAQASLQVHGALDYRPALHCVLTVDAASATLFGGWVRLARPAEVGCPDPDATFWIELLGLELAQLVALENERIEASGQVTGLVPLTLKGGQMSVSGGQVAAQGDGWIRLRDVPQWKAMAGENEQLLFAINALENFNYRVLNSSVDLTPTGWLHLGVSMQGQNPDFQAGQVIHYNLNVESNLPSLLKSLRMAEDISHQLQEKLQ